MGFLTLKSLHTWWEMRSWQEVPAVILEASLESSSGSDSTTYSVRAQYEYVFREQRYVGDRVGIHGGSDNLGDFHQRVVDELESYRSSGEPFRCFVDPEAPHRSILYRELRLGVLAFYGLFVLLFGGAGFGILGFTLWASRRARVEETSKAAMPREPWKWRPEWSEGKIASTGRGVMIGAWIFAGLWNLISAPILFILPREVLEDKNYPALLVLLFPLVGLGLLTWAIRATLQWRRFGRSVFEMARVPGVVGGPLQGIVRLPTRLPPPQDGFRMDLSCVRRRRRGSGKNRHTEETVLWQDQRVLDRGLSAGSFSGTVLPVIFAIPYEAEETDPEDPTDQVLWKLRVQADIPGVDLDQTFEVPVFRTEESSPDFVLEEGRLGDYERPRRLEDVLRHRGAEARDLPGGGRRYFFPPHATLLQKLVVGSLTVGLGIALGVMLRLGAGWVPLLVVGLFELLVASSAFNLWLERYRVQVEKEQVTLMGGFFGPGKATVLPVSEIASWEATAGVQRGSQTSHDLVVATRGGKRHVAVRGLCSLRDAELLREDILGLFPTRS